MTDGPGARGRAAEWLHLDRRLIRKAIRRIAPQVRGVVLDVGCGRRPYRDEFPGATKYLGIDRDAAADVVHDLASFPYPLADACADWIVCTQVLDDLPDQESFVRELRRLLKPGGGLFLSASFVWELHDLPADYGRPTGPYLRRLLESNGFRVQAIEGLGNSWTTLGQVLNINLCNLVGKRKWGVRMLSPLLLANSLIFHGLGRMLQGAEAARLPLAHAVVARRA